MIKAKVEIQKTSFINKDSPSKCLGLEIYASRYEAAPVDQNTLAKINSDLQMVEHSIRARGYAIPMERECYSYLSKLYSHLIGLLETKKSKKR
ncbi:MAG: hypothetical protein GY938_31045 [Ketobacter sp.]|nr:hypothetical protein [Ketobacter sp.]